MVVGWECGTSVVLRGQETTTCDQLGDHSADQNIGRVTWDQLWCTGTVLKTSRYNDKYSVSSNQVNSRISSLAHSPEEGEDQMEEVCARDLSYWEPS